MGRPPIYDQPMTAAERMPEYRTRKRVGAVAAPGGVDGTLAKLLPTVKARARYLGMSERSYYRLRKYDRHHPSFPAFEPSP